MIFIKEGRRCPGEPYLRSVFSEAARAVLPVCLLLIVFKAFFLVLTTASPDAFLLGMRGILLVAAGALLGEPSSSSISGSDTTGSRIDIA